MGAFMIEPGTGLRANDLTVWNIIFHTEKDVVIYGGRSLRQIPVLKVGLSLRNGCIGIAHY